MKFLQFIPKPKPQNISCHGTRESNNKNRERIKESLLGQKRNCEESNLPLEHQRDKDERVAKGQKRRKVFYEKKTICKKRACWHKKQKLKIGSSGPYLMMIITQIRPFSHCLHTVFTSISC